jgi:hypothetical protein
MALFLFALERAKGSLKCYSKYSYDLTGVEPLSDTCKEALSIKPYCHKSLDKFLWKKIQPTSKDLESLCVPVCSFSLTLARKHIVSGCARESVLHDNETYPATHMIDEYIDAKDRLCLRDA